MTKYALQHNKNEALFLASTNRRSWQDGKFFWTQDLTHPQLLKYKKGAAARWAIQRMKASGFRDAVDVAGMVHARAYGIPDMPKAEPTIEKPVKKTNGTLDGFAAFKAPPVPPRTLIPKSKPEGSTIMMVTVKGEIGSRYTGVARILDVIKGLNTRGEVKVTYEVEG